MRRIGLLGGTFDPPHRGHLTLAHHFAQTLQLDEIVWIPTGHSWQKVQTLASTHRLAMTRLIAEELQQQLLSTLAHTVQVSVNQIEIQRAGPSYTLDTLRELRSQYGENCILCWLMGLDQLLHLTTWNTWQQLFDYSHICVANRPGYTFDPAKDLNDFLRAHLGQVNLVQSSTHGVLLFDAQLNVEISSTQLRAQLEHYSHDSTSVPSAGSWDLRKITRARPTNQDNKPACTDSFTLSRGSSEPERQGSRTPAGAFCASPISTWLTPAVVGYIEQHQLYFNN